MFCALSRGGGGGGMDDMTAVDQSSLQHRVLIACERWTKFVPLQMDFEEKTMPLVVHVFRSRTNSRQENVLLPMETAAFAYIICIYDGACMTTDQIIAASVGSLNDSGNAN